MERILPLTYLGSTSYYAALAQGDVVVDLGEHFVKRSARNRTRIISPNGTQDLTVPVRRANHPQTPMCDMRIDYSKRWQHQHWGAIVSSYAHAPYFEHYRERFEPFYRHKTEFLVDYDWALMEVVCGIMKIPMPQVSEAYIDAPKIVEPIEIAYTQVFSDRMPFVPELSIIDFLFSEGPSLRSL